MLKSDKDWAKMKELLEKLQDIQELIEGYEFVNEIVDSESDEVHEACFKLELTLQSTMSTGKNAMYEHMKYCGLDELVE